MIIQCENCGTQHELDPPSWVVSSGRAFRFRCSACGHSQSVQPDQAGREAGAVVAPTEVPATRAMGPTGSPAAPEPPRPNPTLTPVVETVAASTPEPVVAPPALLDSVPPAAERDHAPRPPTQRPAPIPPLATAGILDIAPPRAPTPPPPVAEPPAGDSAVFLKQNGQIYRVQDWATLKRWIDEGRVDHNDLVSEGGVRWEPIGSRRDLVAAPERRPASAPPPLSAPFPFGGDAPFGSTPAGVDRAWSDDDTEGVPTGLPPLPTEESVALDAPRPSDEPQPPALVEPAESPGHLRYEPTSEVVEADAFEAGSATPVPAVRAPEPAPVAAPPPFAPLRPSGPAPTAPPRAPLAAEWEDLLNTGEMPLPAPPPVSSITARPSPSAAAPPSTAEPAFPPGPVSLPPAELDAEWETVPPTRWWPFVAGGVALVLLLVVVAFAVWPDSGSAGHVPPVPAPGGIAVVPAPPPVVPAPPPVVPAPVVPAPVVPTPVAPTPVAPGPVAPVAPTPVAPVPVAPVPAPPPVTPPPAPDPVVPKPSTSAKALVQKGWTLIDAQPANAQKMFQQALDLEPGNEEAAYGFGYALLLQNKLEEATPWLCRVRNSRNAEIRQDANGMINSRQLQCP